ncbi:outer membrane protein assembly factor BamB family protein [Bremerella sp. P1]|uniref:outer membrane protein assembly factor BamB family protein n=1 Tax=Bremerella sp. P1 TaxID=3026424 RepID=UPI0023674CE9|nr:PQQ-binding-like beta-propeller repeat protein [Bremerella sp. P1]WDI42472.1 PQQ-binding-like beta-propeller repeat protein [Bremerella sp. P1]
MKSIIPAVLLLVTTIVSSAAADNWPSWRGPENQGISYEKNLPTQWSADKNIAWRLPMPGAAGSTPVIWDDHIFLTSVADDDLVLMCVGTDGVEKWRRKLGSGNRDVRGDEGNSAAPSPSTDGKHVWAFFSNGSLACFDFEGKEVWQIDVQEKYGKFDIQFGLTSTPVLHNDKIYLQLIHSGGAKVVAIDKATGKEAWVTDRTSDARQECEHSYASPIVYDGKEAKFLLTHGADYSIAYDLETGKEIWRVGGLHPPGRYDVTLRFVSSPVAKDGMVVVPSAKRGITAAVKTTGKGNITDKKDLYYWTFEITPDVPSPLIVDDLVYLCRENGNLIALEKESGKQLYEERTNRIRHRASPVYADGKIYLTGRDGMVTVVQAGPEFKILAQNEVGEAIAASPVISNGRIYLRTFDALWAIGSE